MVDFIDTKTCGKCGEQMSGCTDTAGTPHAGVCPDHGVMYANPKYYQ